VSDQYAEDLARAQQVVPARSSTWPMLLLMLLLAGSAFAIIWYWPIILRILKKQ
jgi:hypothetical protein